MKTHEAPLGTNATNIRPGDFPIGSPQSRAAVRMLLEQSTALSPEDEDCLTLFRLGLDMGVEISNNPAVKRGYEVSLRTSGEIVPAHLDPKSKRSTSASMTFKRAFGREPKCGDILCPGFIEPLYTIGEELIFEKFKKAWDRQNPDTPCPMRFENGKRYGSTWPWPLSRDPKREWRHLEWDELKTFPNQRVDDAPRAIALYFLGVVGGQHKTRVATEEELASYIPPNTGFVGRLVEILQRKNAPKG